MRISNLVRGIENVFIGSGKAVARGARAVTHSTKNELLARDLVASDKAFHTMAHLNHRDCIEINARALELREVQLRKELAKRIRRGDIPVGIDFDKATQPAPK